MRSQNPRTIARLLLLAATVAAVAAAAPAAALAATAGSGQAHPQQQGGPTEIDSCTVIDEPGRYVLTEDIENSTADVCIDIRASDVVLDGNGYTVDGNLSRTTIEEAAQGPPPRTRVGVGVNVRTDERVSNVTVSNVEVTDWYHGVLSENVTGGTTTDVDAFDNGGGIVYDNSSDVAVVDSTSSNNVILGIIVDSRQGVRNADTRVVDNVARNNGFHGIAIALSNASTIADNTVSGNTFGLFSYGTVGTTFEDNDARNNTVGLYFYGEQDEEDEEDGAVEAVPVDAVEPRVASVNVSRNNVVTDNDFSDSGYNGIVVDTTTRSRFEDNDVSSVTGTGPFPNYYATAGIVLNESSHNLVVDNEVNEANGSGIVLGNDSDGNAFVGNDVNENAEDGVLLRGADHTALIRNTIAENGDDGVDVEGSNGVLLLVNRIEGNADEAVEVTNSTDVVRVDTVGGGDGGDSAGGDGEGN